MNNNGTQKLGLVLLLLLYTSMPTLGIYESNSRTVIDLKGSTTDSVVSVVQLSDLHFSVHHPERALDFKRLVGPALDLITPSLVLITGDLTDGKSKDLLKMKQNEEEWKEYQEVMEDVIKRSGLDKKIFYDLRGNHDNFGVPSVGGPFDFFSNYSINGGLRRKGNVHSITLQSGGRKHLFVGFDSTMAVGLRGPTNLFGHPTDKLLADIDYELSQWDSQPSEPVTKISFGHFPLSFSAVAESGKTFRDIFLKHSLSTYLCGHLHVKFGKNLKRHHQSRNGFFSSEQYFQLNMQQLPVASAVETKNCFNATQSIEEFWEYEMGDWRKSRLMRVLAIDSGHISFVDINFTTEAKRTILLPTFPLDSRFISSSSYQHDYDCNSVDSSFFETVRALVFSKSVIVSVVARIYDTRHGHHHLIMEANMRKQENSTREGLYSVPWNWKAFEDPSPDRFWLQIEATDISGKLTMSELRPFSVNGVGMKIRWTWIEFLVMGCQWANLYYPIFWSVLLFLFSVLITSKVLFSCSSKKYVYKNFIYKKSFSSCLFWVLAEISSISSVWASMMLYLLYLIFFPWFWGQIFTEGDDRGYMRYKGWTLNIAEASDEQTHHAHPDIMVIVLPHLCFVVLPTILVTAALCAERTIYREHHLSLSGKKEDDYNQETERVATDNHAHGNRSKLCGSNRWARKFLIVICMAVGWKHWQLCRAVTTAYEMNPFLHSPMYCFAIPLLLIYAFYRTATV
ncbi:hypothetical protein Sjap_009389 [Stephania japonica]|uniref:Calcineurin-like phosphoesterase domain-containing protein n=1 Tax=Stephania japonica TaxID=461633 RepID=A0AAP0JTL4_9MAGN